MAARMARVLAPLVTLMLLAPPAAAQRVLLSSAGPGLPRGTDLLDLATGTVQRLADDTTDKAVFLADGSVLLRRVSGEQRWRARFMATGTEVVLPNGFAPVFFGARSIVLPHPREMAVFGLFQDAAGTNFPSRLDGAGFHVFQPCGPGLPYDGFDVSPDGASLIVACQSVFSNPAVPPDVVVIDSRTGAERHRLPAVTPSSQSPVFTSSGTEFLAIRSPSDYAIVRVDVMTGLVTGTVTFARYNGIGPGLLPNLRDRDHPLLIRCGAVCTVDVVDATTLLIGPRLFTGGGNTVAASFSADGRHVVLSGDAYVARVELATGLTVNVIDAPANGFVVAALGAEPQPPVLAPSVLTGNAVSLPWSLPGRSAAVTDYRLEVGSRAGVSDLVELGLGPATTFQAAGVPPGRYYARLRALNANGVSARSNEIVIDVP